jgi:hypothetical protein
VTRRGETKADLAVEGRPSDASVYYERHYTDSWAKETLKTVAYWLDGNVVKLQGTCWRCGHQLDDFFVIKDDLARTIEANHGLQRVEERLEPGGDHLTLGDVLACNCENVHSGRPADKRGCGSFARLDIELATASPNGVPHAMFLETRRAILRDRAWDEAAERAELERLASVQTHAEKQSGFFTAVLGLLSAALILQGTEHILLKPLGVRLLITALFALAVGAGAVAILFIARAARGSTRTEADVTGPSFYARTDKEIEKAMRRLHQATLPAALALAFLVSTVGLIWLVPD